ncbi:MAG: hypothetical protein KC425_07155, partial [Anaerolineales bacterium]|nr:hypothetical protein [Anaerolineales bacterium]
GEVLRFALLSAHYRSPLNFSAELLEQAEATLGNLYSTLRSVADVTAAAAPPLADEPFYAALNDDLNTPVAIAELHALARQIHKASDAAVPALKARLLGAAELLGILREDPQAWLQHASGAAIAPAEIEALIDERQQAKLAKDYDRADEIRQSLLDRGVILEDSRDGTRWRRGSD